MRKLYDNKGIGVVEILAIIALAMVVAALICNFARTDIKQMPEINTEYLHPTAGIITYMGYLEKNCMDGAEVVELPVIVVEAAEVGEIEQAEEISPEELLVNLFGYVPSNAEMDLLYRAVQKECGFLEPDEGVMAVVYVIANRVRSEDYPNTIYGVISQKNQFETWSNGAIQSCDYVEDYFIEIIDDVIAEDPHPEYRDLMSFTSGYYNPYFEPAFVIGHHYFGR